MTVEDLRREWERALDDAPVDARTCVLFIVQDQQPADRSEAAYLQPNHLLNHQSPLVLQRVGPGLIGDYSAQHKVAVWQHLQHDEEALAAALFLRHELQHVAQFEAGGFELFELYEDLRAALRDRFGDASDEMYFGMPPESDANAAAAIHARAHREEQLERRENDPMLRQFFTDAPAPDETTLAERTIAALLDAARPDLIIDGRSLDELVTARRRAVENWPPGGLELTREQYRRDPGVPGIVLVR
jgi:hypothetical protein